MVSSRSGLVDRRATGAPINSSTWRTYLMAWRGKLGPAAGTDGRFFPAFQRDVNGLCLGLLRLACRQVIDLGTVQRIADADLQFIKAVEHIELGERDTGNAVGGNPTGAPEPHRTSRNGACAP